MKIIFLDIDGVLSVQLEDRDAYGELFHDNFLKNLEMIIKETGAKIVLSSSWRKNGLRIIKEMWANRDLPGQIIDVTPSLYLTKNGGIQFWNDKLFKHPSQRVHGYSLPRGAEIDYWLRNEYYHYAEKITDYVIIDDDSDMLLHQRDKFVHCSGNHDHKDSKGNGKGLTLKCAYKAIKILNTKTYNNFNDRFGNVYNFQTLEEFKIFWKNINRNTAISHFPKFKKLQKEFSESWG